MSFKAAASHQDRFVIKTEIGIPWDSAVKNDSVMNGNIRTEDSVANNEKEKNSQFGISGRENQPEKVDKFCFDK